MKNQKIQTEFSILFFGTSFYYDRFWYVYVRRPILEDSGQ